MFFKLLTADPGGKWVYFKSKSKSAFQNSEWNGFDFQPQNEQLPHTRPSSCIWFIKPCVSHWLSPTTDSAQCPQLQERFHRRQTVQNHIGIITHQSQQFKRITITWRQTIISFSWLSHWLRWFYSGIDHFESFTIYTACGFFFCNYISFQF